MGEHYLQAEPFLRWAGGKRWLARLLGPCLSDFLQESHGSYIEPFLGAGAMFFAVRPNRAVLSDTNDELIETYRLVASRHREIERKLKRIRISARSYYRWRASTSLSGVTKATRFIFLNRTCYGGLYRTNLSGVFNVPYGGGSRTPEVLWKHRILSRAAAALNHDGISLECCDFQQTLNKARRGDVVYCDPTYITAKRGPFDRYGANVFSWSDQERLAESVRNLARRGAMVIVSNAASRELIDLFDPPMHFEIERKKVIGKRPLNGDAHREFVFIFFPRTPTTATARNSLRRLFEAAMEQSRLDEPLAA
jgi:DNA adenine methylase